MTTLTMFGLSLAPLYAAIAEVETENGRTDANVYQLQADYVDDVNRIIESRYRKTGEGRYPRTFMPKDALNLAHAEYMMAMYWSHWGRHYQEKTGKPVTYETLARIHNGGPIGWKRNATCAYWHKVEAAMAKFIQREAWQ